MDSDAYRAVLEAALKLPAEQQRKLMRELESALAPPPSSGKAKTVGEYMQEKGFFGMFEGPPDLSTNPKYMEGFGENGDQPN